MPLALIEDCRQTKFLSPSSDSASLIIDTAHELFIACSICAAFDQNDGVKQNSDAAVKGKSEIVRASVTIAEAKCDVTWLLCRLLQQRIGP